MTSEVNLFESINVKVFDNEHNEIANKLSELRDLCNSGANSDLVRQKAEELYYIIKAHFRHEEDEMTSIKYSNFFSHKCEHDKFLRKISNQIEYLKKNINLNNEFFNYSNQWLLSHLELKDKKLGLFLNEQGIF